MTQEELRREEQGILDELIRDMDKAILEVDKNLTSEKLKKIKAQRACLPDAYGQLVSSEYYLKNAVNWKKILYQGRNELYEDRIIVDLKDEESTQSSEEEIKIGLHSYMYKDRLFVASWTMPVCRHYILDKSDDPFDAEVIDKRGVKHRTHYELLLKRHVRISFDKVREVVHYYPEISEEQEEIIADEFLRELASRRGSQEFKNIVFSIQKKQGEIIQALFSQNMIVQGCAGSGKSMIMLHRLPILLYDNPNSLKRNSLYIITPSITYIQMAHNMLYDLEIADLNMGTLEQYYNHVLGRYGKKPEDYGEIKPFIKLKASDLKYVYSSDCVKEIQRKIADTLKNISVDHLLGCMILDVKEESSNAGTPKEKVRKEKVAIQSLLNENNRRLNQYHRASYRLLEDIDELARFYETRKTALTREFDRRISEKQQLIAGKNKEIEILDLNPQSIRYKNRKNDIEAAEKTIADLRETREIIELDNAYFDRMLQIAGMIRNVLKTFGYAKKEFISLEPAERYKLLSAKDNLCGYSAGIQKVALGLEDPYWEYVVGCGSIIKKVQAEAEALKRMDMLCLPEDYEAQLRKALADYNKIDETLVKNIYLDMMKRLGQEPDQRGKLDALTCSPYLYLQILLQYSGTPSGNSENLITIDEAQNLESEEIKLIRAVNGGKVILNLFGDVHQHVEDSKGINSWEELNDAADFRVEQMEENYRNARQITEFCNRRFSMNMRAINLDGSGVHEITTKESFGQKLDEVLRAPQKAGLSCIIVKDAEEADLLMNLAGNHSGKIMNMTKEVTELQRNKWNLLTCEQSKGLEFQTVFAVSGKMSNNEKYIAYTRALDELYVYDLELPLVDKKIVSEKGDEETVDRGNRGSRGGRPIRGSKK